MQLSRLDTLAFGVAVGRAGVASPGEAASATEDARRAGAALLILRVAVADTPTAHAVEAAGGRLCDTLLYYECDPSDAVEPSGVRPATAADASEIQRVAAQAFMGYVGHYHADPRLSKIAADAAYVDWARRSVLEPSAADRVWVAEEHGEIAGFLTWRLNRTDEGEIVLNGVHPLFRRRGHYRRLVERALAETRHAGAKSCVVSTQLVNWPVQQAWVGFGFRPVRALYTFHLWLE